MSDETYYHIKVTESDFKALVRIKNYFGENDKSQIEHIAYDVLTRIVKPLEEINKTDNVESSI